MMSGIRAHDWLVKALRTLTEFLQQPYTACNVSLLTYPLHPKNLGFSWSFPTSLKWEGIQVFSPALLCSLHLFLRRLSLSWPSPYFIAQGIHTFIFSCPPHHPYKVLASSRSQARVLWQEHFKEGVTHCANFFKEISSGRNENLSQWQGHGCPGITIKADVQYTEK